MLHAIPQLPLLQVARPFAVAGHARSQAPHVAGAARSVSQPLDALPSQFANPALHETPHDPAAHVARPLAGAAHARSHAPQCARVTRVSTSQPLFASPSQSAKPGLQVKPQLPAAHVGMAFAAVGHGTQRVPQVATAASSAQAIPQAWYPVLHAMPQLPAAQVARPFAGTRHA